MIIKFTLIIVTVNNSIMFFNIVVIVFTISHGIFLQYWTLINDSNCNYMNWYFNTCSRQYKHISEILECSSNPCKNGATCSELMAGYRCSCANGFTGTNCEAGSKSHIAYHWPFQNGDHYHHHHHHQHHHHNHHRHHHNKHNHHHQKHNHHHQQQHKHQQQHYYYHLYHKHHLIHDCRHSGK